MRRHAEQGGNGGHTGAADAGDQHVVFTLPHGRFRRGQGSLGQARARAGLGGFDRGLIGLFPGDGDEGRAEALEAGIVLVADALVDLALAAQRGFDGLDGHAVGLHAAVATALADG